MSFPLYGRSWGRAWCQPGPLAPSPGVSCVPSSRSSTHTRTRFLQKCPAELTAPTTASKGGAGAVLVRHALPSTTSFQLRPPPPGARAQHHRCAQTHGPKHRLGTTLYGHGSASALRSLQRGRLRHGEDATIEDIMERLVIPLELRQLRVDQIDVAIRREQIDRLLDALAHARAQHL